MPPTIGLPDNSIGSPLAVPDNDLDRTALERLALDGYLSGALSIFQVQKRLGFGDRFETQAWLGLMGAHESYTLDDLDADRRTLDGLLPS